MASPFRYCASCILMVLAASTAQAVVVDGAITEQNGAGEFIKLDPEEILGVGEDTFDTPHLYAFDEDQNIVLPADIKVDIGRDGLVIPEGTVVASHYVFFDGLSGWHRGYVVFDAPVLGIAAHEKTMANTDFLANTDVIYLSPALRGLEERDFAWIDPEDPFRIWVDWASSTPGDYIRVFTERSLTPMM